MSRKPFSLPEIEAGIADIVATHGEDIDVTKLTAQIVNICVQQGKVYEAEVYEAEIERLNKLLDK